MIQIPPHVLEWLEGLERAAYQQGWDDATKALFEAAASKRPGGGMPAAATPALTATVPPAPVESVPASSLPRFDGETNRQRITRALRIRPGMRAADVPRWLHEAGDEIAANSILTTIKRMRRDGSIRNDGVRLFLTESSKEAAE